MNKLRFIFIVAILATMAAGCAKEAARTAAGEGRRTSRAEALEVDLAAMEAATTSLKALAHVELVSGGEERKTDVALVLERPANVRADAFDALADVWAQAGSTHDRLWLYLPNPGKFYSGRASRRNLNRLANFDWDVPGLIAVLAGTPPIGEHPFLLQVGRGGERHFRLRGSTMHLWTDRKGRVERFVRYGDDGMKIDYIVEFDDYRRAGKVEFPYLIKATFPDRRARILVEYRDVTLGEAVTPDTFLPPKRRRGKTVKLRGR